MGVRWAKHTHWVEGSTMNNLLHASCAILESRPSSSDWMAVQLDWMAVRWRRYFLISVGGVNGSGSFGVRWTKHTHWVKKFTIIHRLPDSCAILESGSSTTEPGDPGVLAEYSEYSPSTRDARADRAVIWG